MKKKDKNIKRKAIVAVVGVIILTGLLVAYKHYHEATIEKRIITTYGACIEEWKSFYDRKAQERGGRREIHEDPQGDYERAYCYCLAGVYVKDRGFNPDKDDYKAYRSYTYTTAKDDTEKPINACVKERLNIKE